MEESRDDERTRKELVASIPSFIPALIVQCGNPDITQLAIVNIISYRH